MAYLKSFDVKNMKSKVVLIFAVLAVSHGAVPRDRNICLFIDCSTTASPPAPPTATPTPSPIPKTSPPLPVGSNMGPIKVQGLDSIIDELVGIWYLSKCVRIFVDQKNVSWQDELNTEVKSLNQPNSLIGKVAGLTVDLVRFDKTVMSR